MCPRVYTYIIEDNISLQVLKTATTCTRQVADSFLSNVDIWISNAAQFVTRQLLQALKDLLRGIYNMYIMYVCVW